MRLDFAFLCDSHSTNAEGKVTAVGIGVSQIGVTDTPAMHPRIDLIASARDKSAAAGTHKYSVRVHAPSGQEIGRVDNTFELTRPSGQGSDCVGFIRVQLSPFPIDYIGTYTIRLSVDGKTFPSLTLEVVHVSSGLPGARPMSLGSV